MSSNNATFIPLDGRITSLQVLDLSLTGGEVVEIVSPGNAAFGNNYQVALSNLAAFFAGSYFLNTVEVTSGATLGSPYTVGTTVTVVLLNKSASSNSYVVLPLASSMRYPNSILIKDFKGDAYSYPVSITFTGGQLCDGLIEIQITNAFGWVRITPSPDGLSYYMS